MGLSIIYLIDFNSLLNPFNSSCKFRILNYGMENIQPRDSKIKLNQITKIFFPDNFHFLTWS